MQIFHLKVSGQQNWGKMPQVIDAIEKARAEGIDVTANQYPYIASATSLGAIIPPKYHEGGTDAFVARLKDPAARAQIRKELEGRSGSFENMWRGTGGPEWRDGRLCTRIPNSASSKARPSPRLARWRTKIRSMRHSTSSSPITTTSVPFTSA